MCPFQEYILTKNEKLRNFVTIGNEDFNSLKIFDAYGRYKGTSVAVDYVWFKVKNHQLLCTRNEYNSNLEVIRKFMNADSEEHGTIFAEGVDVQNSMYIKAYHNLLAEQTPPLISRIVSLFLYLPNLIFCYL